MDALLDQVTQNNLLFWVRQSALSSLERNTMPYCYLSYVIFHWLKDSRIPKTITVFRWLESYLLSQKLETAVGVLDPLGEVNIARLIVPIFVHEISAQDWDLVHPLEVESDLVRRFREALTTPIESSICVPDAFV